ncbi:hypothetical protein DL98DRAFT_149497 [Cadophora sp. DSE1049]|nr:hypothetical protein DL98DRAFT_149497 [Cadophora sp. DSE1049]
MSILCVAHDRSTIPVAGICSNPAVPVHVFYDLIWLIPQFQKDSTLFNDAFNLDGECKSALRKCGVGDGPWHPKTKIEKYLDKVKKKYAAQRQEGIAREEGPVGGKVFVGEEVPVREDGQVEGKVLVKDEDTAAKEVKWLNATRAWPSKLREASGKSLSKLESDPKIETWCDGDSRYYKLKEGVDGTPSQSKDATNSPHPQQNEAGDSGHLRPPKRKREDSSDGQHGDGEQPQSTNIPSSDHTQASLGLGVQQEARRVETDDMIIDPKQNGIQPQLPPQPPHQQPPQNPSLTQSPKLQSTPSSGNTPKGLPLTFLKNAVPNPFLPENKGKPTGMARFLELFRFTDLTQPGACR